MRIFIIKNTDAFPIAATIDEQKAIQMCNENSALKWYYAEVPVYMSEGIEIHLIDNRCPLNSNTVGHD